MCVEAHVVLVYTEFSWWSPLGAEARGPFRSSRALRTSFRLRSRPAGGRAVAACLWFDLGNAEAPESWWRDVEWPRFGILSSRFKALSLWEALGKMCTPLEDYPIETFPLLFSHRVIVKIGILWFQKGVETEEGEDRIGEFHSGRMGHGVPLGVGAGWKNAPRESSGGGEGPAGPRCPEYAKERALCSSLCGSVSLFSACTPESGYSQATAFVL